MAAKDASVEVLTLVDRVFRLETVIKELQQIVDSILQRVYRLDGEGV